MTDEKSPSRKVLAIVQARMSSTRLPGKVLMHICGKPMLQHLIERLQHSRLVQQIVVATTSSTSDDTLAAFCQTIGTNVFRGDENDVLDRFYQCGKKFKAEVVVRITADCPLLDPEVVDKTIGLFMAGHWDYVSNAYPRATFPDGLDTEVFSFHALQTAWQQARLPSEREHVTPYLWKNEQQLFRLGALASDNDLSQKRWTVDEDRDLAFVAEIYGHLYHIRPSFSMKDILALLKRHPEIESLNSSIVRNAGYLKSLERDREPQT